MSDSKSLWSGIRARSKSLVVLFATYIPAVFAAGYLDQRLTGAYTAAFWVGGAYMVGLLLVLVQIARSSTRPK